MNETSSTDNYKSVSGPSSGVYRELGSKFISLAFPVTSEEEAKEIIKSIKKEYFDARHHCYAYRIGAEGKIWRTNDDGEPSSSAGRPILGQILSNELSDILILVVRYFGGTKLGIPGLIRSYKSAAADAIGNSVIIIKTATEDLSISFDYEKTEPVMKLVKSSGLQIKKELFDLRCSLTLQVKVSEMETVRKLLSDINGVDL